MRHVRISIVFTAAAAAIVSLTFPLGAQAPKPKHINRAIELLEAGQPVYYTGSHNGTEGTFEAGKADAQTFADYISYDMEHAPYDVKGLAAAGPTKSGHRTPAVIVNVPVNGIDEGRRGAHGSPTAAAIWGVSTQEYEDKADVWPLNPNGELLLGVKLEDKYALANAEQNLKVPGIGFAEWGPGDMALSLGVRGPGNVAEKDPKMVAARAKVFAACKANRIFFLNSMNQNNVVDMIKEGVMVGPASRQAAEIGRQYTRRTMPW